MRRYNNMKNTTSLQEKWFRTIFVTITVCWLFMTNNGFIIDKEAWIKIKTQWLVLIYFIKHALSSLDGHFSLTLSSFFISWWNGNKLEIAIYLQMHAATLTEVIAVRRGAATRVRLRRGPIWGDTTRPSNARRNDMKLCWKLVLF